MLHCFTPSVVKMATKKKAKKGKKVMHKKKGKKR
jgi:hypothetical protein